MRLLNALLVSVVALAGTQGSVKSIKGFEHFQEWSRLVWAHTPGQLDDAAREVAAWPQADLLAVRTDLWAAVKLIVGGGSAAQYTPQLVRARFGSRTFRICSACPVVTPCGNWTPKRSHVS